MHPEPWQLTLSALPGEEGPRPSPRDEERHVRPGDQAAEG